MYGRYEAYDKVPLGVKVVVSAIYEPPQSCGADSIQVTLESSGSSSSLIISPQESQVDEMARDVFGGGGGMPILEKVGMIYTDLLDTGARDGSVVCKRHADSYFLSSAEIIFAAQMQTAHPMVCRYAPPTSSSSSGSQGGVFGSRFSTCVITGKRETTRGGG